MIKDSYLSFNGYVLPKKNLTKEQINDIKKHLTVVPQNNEYSGKSDESTKYKVYKETDTEFIIPKYFGIDRFKYPEEKYEGKPANIEFTGTLRDYQKEITDKCLKYLKKHNGGLLSVPCGQGKCLQKGTLVMMFDGTLKKVEDIEIGEQIMGDDSTPRTILSLARGTEEMFDIINTETSEKYTVNRSHILSLKQLDKNDEIIDISVDEYLKLEKSEQDNLRGYKVPICFNNNDILNKDMLLDQEKDIINFCNVGYQFVCCEREEKLHEHNIFTETNNYKSDKINHCYKKYDLIDESNNFKYRIPLCLKTSSIQIRKNILKGIVDTCGTLISEKGDTFKTFLLKLYNKTDQLAEDIIYLARSLGYCCYIKNDTDAEVVKIIISDNTLNYEITVKSVGNGEYYGFEINGNKRFVLGDFTVTHNTSMAIYMASVLGYKTLVLTHKTFLQDQWVDRIKQFTKSEVGIIRQNKVDVKNKDFVIGMIHSIAKRNYDPDLFKDFQILIIDECHHFSANHFANALFKCSTKYTIGLSATPYRNDGLMKVTNWFVGDIMYQKKLKINNQVVSKIITFTSNDKSYVEIKQPRKIQERGRWVTKMQPDYVQMISNITELKERNDMIINIIDYLRRDPDRKILILSDRIAHLKLLKEGVDKKIQASVDALQILPDEIKTYFYIGDLKRKQREEAEDEADILFGSFGLAKEGLDIDRLNTIILATPQKDVIQAVGRILRKVLQTGDIRPLIIDIADTLSMFPSQLKKREDFYTKSKYIQHYYYAHEGKLISPAEHLKMQGRRNTGVNDDTPKDFSEILDIPLVEITNEEIELNVEVIQKTPESDDGNESDTSASVSSTESMKLTKQKKIIKKTTKVKKDDPDDEKPKKKSTKVKVNDSDDEKPKKKLTKVKTDDLNDKKAKKDDSDDEKPKKKSTKSSKSDWFDF